MLTLCLPSLWRLWQLERQLHYQRPRHLLSILQLDINHISRTFTISTHHELSRYGTLFSLYYAIASSDFVRQYWTIFGGGVVGGSLLVVLRRTNNQHNCLQGVTALL